MHTGVSKDGQEISCPGILRIKGRFFLLFLLGAQKRLPTYHLAAGGSEGDEKALQALLQRLARGSEFKVEGSRLP